jgi:drug/metabolite transporter (DMT)-like permease
LNKNTATAIGFLAILSWAFLAFLTTASGGVPPFELAAITFLIGGLTGASTWPFRKGAVANLKQSWKVWALGTAGLCIYHCTYFFALQSAPPVEASLIAYLWPLLIVVFASFLPGEKFEAHHKIGIVLGLLGAVLIITKGFTVGFASGLKLGHFLAMACALIWSAYSVASRRMGHVPTDVVAGFCFITSAVATTLHFALEPTIQPQFASQWVAIIALGLFPLGTGFFAWDIGMKRGDIMVLGALSYAAPLLSTLVMLATGYAAWHWSIATACVLITLGAAISAKDIWQGRKTIDQVNEAA